MSDVAIRVQNLSKLYRLGQRERYKTIRDTLTDAIYAPFRRVRSTFQRSNVSTREHANDNYIWALKDVSFEVKRGEVLGIIGRNGAGKTTLLKILSRITEPTEGYAEIYGRVGSLLEVGTGFHPELTGRENIYLNGAILGMKKAEIDRKFDEIVDFAEIGRFIDTPVKRYSSGMYVRLAFAVAAHLEPEILLVDEVLAVGDAAFQRKCLGKMEAVSREGRTILFVSHNMAAIQGLTSRCLLLANGQILKQGATKEVIEEYLSGSFLMNNRTIQNRTDRRGNGVIRFVNVVILNSRKLPVSCVHSGQDISIAISYKAPANERISRLDVHITFYSILGHFMFNCPTEGSGLSLEEAPASATLVCHIPQLPLAPGRYTFNLYSTVGGAIADWVEQAGFLDVIEGDFFGTGQLKTHRDGFLVKHSWTLIEGNNF